MSSSCGDSHDLESPGKNVYFKALHCDMHILEPYMIWPKQRKTKMAEMNLGAVVLRCEIMASGSVKLHKEIHQTYSHLQEFSLVSFSAQRVKFIQ